MTFFFFVNMHACTKNTMRTFTNDTHNHKRIYAWLTSTLYRGNGEESYSYKSSSSKSKRYLHSSIFVDVGKMSLCGVVVCTCTCFFVYVLLHPVLCQVFLTTIFCQYWVRQFTSAVCFGDNFRLAFVLSKSDISEISQWQGKTVIRHGRLSRHQTRTSLTWKNIIVWNLEVMMTILKMPVNLCYIIYY